MYRDRLSVRPLKQDNNKNYDFTIYLMDVSYFSGKIEIYFKFKSIEYKRIESTSYELLHFIGKNTGTSQVPVVYDNRPDINESKRWLRDSTYIIEYLENNLNDNSKSVYPDCEIQKFFCELFEDYADEFLWRPAMYFRWAPDYDYYSMSLRFTYEFARHLPAPIPNLFSIRSNLISLRQWFYSIYCENINTNEKHDIIMDQYVELLDILQEILSNQLFLLGNQMTLIDIGFMGPFFRHFSLDATPRKIMLLRAPAVYEWVSRCWNCSSTNFKNIPANFPNSEQLPKNWTKLLQLLPDYLLYYQLNLQNYLNNKPSFDWTYKGQVFNVPVSHYRVFCLQQLQNKYKQLEDRHRVTIKNILESLNCFELFQSGYPISIEPELGTNPPFCPVKSNQKILHGKWNVNHKANQFIYEIIMKYFSIIIVLVTLFISFIVIVFKNY